MLKISSGVITYFKLAAGLGRRNTEMAGWRLLKPKTGSKLTPVGSLTTSIVNSGVTARPAMGRGGHGSPTRISPRLSSSECELSLS